MVQAQRIAFIGAGNMAGALIEGLIGSRTFEPSHIAASDPRPEALARLSALGVTTATSNEHALRQADIAVLCVKPQAFPALLPEIARAMDHDPLVISIAAGVPLSVIEDALGPRCRVVRAMPNTPALVAAGATAIAAGVRATDNDMVVAETVFRAVGIVERVREDLLNAVTALSGSGPAYVFLLAEALAQAGVAAGLPEKVASAFAIQTVQGAGKLLGQSGQAPAALRRNVTSPGGTTQAGIERLEAGGLRALMTEAVLAATRRGQELGEEAARKRG